MRDKNTTEKIKETPYNISPKKLKKIDDAMPYGSRKRVAIEEKTTEDYVADVLNGKVLLYEKGWRIVKACLKVLEEIQEKSKRGESEIDRVLGN